jgi:hypothetical protein
LEKEMKKDFEKSTWLVADPVEVILNSVVYGKESGY